MLICWVHTLASVRLEGSSPATATGFGRRSRVPRAIAGLLWRCLQLSARLERVAICFGEHIHRDSSGLDLHPVHDAGPEARRSASIARLRTIPSVHERTLPRAASKRAPARQTGPSSFVSR